MVPMLGDDLHTMQSAPERQQLLICHWVGTILS